MKPLISQPENLTIKIVDTPGILEYHLDLDQSDIGRVIGKKDVPFLQSERLFILSLQVIKSSFSDRRKNRKSPFGGF